MSEEHQSPCKGLIKTEKELALLGQATTNIVADMGKANGLMQENAKLMIDARIELELQNERLANGNKKFALHAKCLKWMGSAIIVLMVVHGPEILKYIKVPW